MQQADITDDTVLVNFMGAIHQHNIGRLYVVDSLLQLATVNDSAAMYSTLANTYNSAIVPNNGIEQNQKQFNDIYLNYLSGSINYGDLQKLRLLAVKCPYIDGHAVFQARAILAEFDQNLYYSDCPKTDTKPRRIDNSEGIDDTGEIVVYPNPTINELKVSMFVGENEKVDILIYGMMGNLIKEQAIQNQQTKIDLSLLQSGIYLYEIHKGEQSVKNGKFIIAR